MVLRYRDLDVIQFVVEVQKCGFNEASSILSKLPHAKVTCSALTYDHTTAKRATDCVPLFDDYFAGCEYLLDNDNIAHEIDKWCGWPNGTASVLAKNGLISITNKSVAFGEYEPYAGTTNETSMRLIGYHARMWPDNPVREDWKYVPSAQESGYSVGEWQCVPGGEYTSTAKYAAIFEARNGAVCFASNHCWSPGDTSLPEDVTMSCVSFVTNDGTLITYRDLTEKYIRFIYGSCCMRVFPDKNIFFDAYQARMVKVRDAVGTAIASKIRKAGCENFTDVLTASCLGIEEIAEKQECSSWR